MRPEKSIKERAMECIPVIAMAVLPEEIEEELNKRYANANLSYRISIVKKEVAR